MIKHELTAICIALLLPATVLAQPGAAAHDVQSQSQNAQVITPDVLLDLAQRGIQLPSVSWMPDSRHLLMERWEQTSPDGSGTQQISLYDIESGEAERIVAGQSASISPDGKRVAFVRSENQETTLWVHDLTTQESQAVASFGPVAQTFRWMPDSEHIIYVRRERLSGVDRRRYASTLSGPPPAVRVIGGDQDVPSDSEVRIVEVGSGQSRLLHSVAAFPRGLAVFPGGREILIETLRLFEYRDDSGTEELVVVDVESGARRTLYSGHGQGVSPVISPDGKKVAIRYDPAQQVYPRFMNVAVLDKETGEMQQLTAGLYLSGSLTWTEDSQGLNFDYKPGVYRQRGYVDLEGNVSLEEKNEYDVTTRQESPDGRHLLWGKEDASGESELLLTDSKTGQTRVLFQGLGLDVEYARGGASLVRWESHDGLELEGLLIKPVGFREGEKYPMIVELHGGPTGGVRLGGQILNDTHLEWHMWAGRGYAVFIPDYRSSAIYGWEHVENAREHQDSNDQDMKDILSGVDHVVRMGFVDEDKMALIGHSYGALMTNWIIPQDHRFAAAVSKEGLIEFHIASVTGSRVGGNSIYEWLFKDTPWGAPENYRANSIMWELHNTRTPTMLVNGGRSHLYHNEYFYTVLHKHNVPVVYVAYDNEGHTIGRPENQRDLLYRVLNFVEKHLKTGTSEKQP